MTTVATDSLYCSEEFLDRAVPVHDTIDGSYVVWLVDFNSQVATVCFLSAYENKEWQAYKPPTKTMFLDFLKSQEQKASRRKTLRDLLNEGVKLVPVFSSPSCTSFNVGFFYNGIPHKISSQQFTNETDAQEFIDAFLTHK